MRMIIRVFFSSFTLVVWLGTTAAAQVEPDGQTDVWTRARQGDVTAAEALKSSFAETADKEEAQRIARHLLLAGMGDNEHFDFLAVHARAAVDCAAPFPLELDSAGQLAAAGYSEAFLAWAQANDRIAEEAAFEELETHGIDIIYLGSSGDPRAIPILREALHSGNPLVVNLAARQLIALGDRDLSGTLLRIGRERRELATPMGILLLQLDERGADEAARELIADEELLTALMVDRAKRSSAAH